MLHQLFYTDDSSHLQQSCVHLERHTTLQRTAKRDRLITVEIGDKMEEVFYPSSPCL